jgi:hypothetical protein
MDHCCDLIVSARRGDEADGQRGERPGTPYSTEAVLPDEI